MFDSKENKRADKAYRAKLGFFGVFLVSSLLLPLSSWACGGFFCSNQNPVDQSAEQILFAVEGTDITAHIQIQYQGDAPEFSWVLPLPSQPEMTVGTDTLFTALRAVTDPRFQLQWNESPECSFGYDCACDYEEYGFPESEAMDASSSDPNSSEDAGVQILDEGAVGPFDYQVIASSDGSAMFDWLNENGYDQPPSAEELITHYTGLEFVFLALKLQNGKSSGDIQPIVVKYQAPTLACIPLKLTSIAASADMPVYSWVLAKARAVPMNFFHVLLNAKAYDWLDCAEVTGSVEVGTDCYLRTWSNQFSDQCRNSYQEIVTKAVNSANGHGFVTEFAGKSEVMNEAVYREGQYDTTKLEEITDPQEFLSTMLQVGFPRNMLVQEIIKSHIPKPEQPPTGCESDQEFYTWNLEDCLEYMPEDWVFDPKAFVEDLNARIVTPLKEAQQLFADHPYMTRTFTTISPDEMTKDPLFSFNPDLPDVSNIHKSEAKLVCANNNKEEAIGVELLLPDGSTTTVEGSVEVEWCNARFIRAEDANPTVEPAAAEIQVMSESGEPTAVAEDDVEYMDRQLDYRSPDPNQARVTQNEGSGGIAITNSGTFGSTPSSGDSLSANPSARGGSSDGLCTVGNGTPRGSASLLILLLLMTSLVVHRRRDSEA